MRKLLSAIHSYGRESIAKASFMYTSPSPAPSPSYQDLLDRNPSLFFMPPIPVVDSAFDFITLAIITALLLLCLLSFFFIFHLRLKSRRYGHLRDFNSLWTVRILLVLFVSGWAFNEISQLPFFHHHNLLPSSRNLSLERQITLCKLHVVLSLGFFEPGFLVTLLFLINISVKQRNPGEIWSVSSVFLMILPALFLQIIFVFFTPMQSQLPLVMIRNYVLSIDSFGNRCIVCTCPLLSSIIFGAFAVMYSVGLLLSCWRVISLVINKNIRVRINMLGFTVMISLFIQTLLLGAESLWTPEDMAFGGMILGVFMCVAVSAAVGEVILVIKPIVEALAAGSDCCRWSPGVSLRPVAESDTKRAGKN